MRIGPAIFVLLILISAISARAADTEGCLNCHQYQGLARIDRKSSTVRNFAVDISYSTHGLGAHARLSCTDCHVRKEVEVFPHNQVAKVDCMRSCHLSSPSKVEIQYSHRPMEKMLAGSVHSEKVLKRSNELLGSPLAAGQSQCLLCHDEPVFRREDAGKLSEEASLQRCSSCHDESLPQDAKFDFRHVHARTQAAQSPMDTARSCGTCHSNKAIRAEFKLPDSTASYFSSFHGKAALLGSENTANCLSCHAALGQNVHAMRKRDDAMSPIAVARLPDTCRTSGCHGTAGANISAAAVHFDLADAHGLEFGIACLFILMILFTFGPSLLVTALKLLHHAIGKHDPEHNRHSEMVDLIMQTDHGRRRLIRFEIHQRVQHWLLAISFTTLCVTGFPMKFASAHWASWTIDHLGGLQNARTIHRTAGSMLIFGFLYHLMYIMNLVWRAKKRTGKSLRQTIASMPMSVGPRDAKQLHQLLLYLAFVRKDKPSFGKFNPEEKFEYFGVFWGTFMLGLTGLLMWGNTWTSRHLPGRVLTIAALLHTFEAFLALLHIGIVHMANVVLHPAMFPVSRAMLTGETPKTKLAEGHGEMIKDIASEIGIKKQHPEVPHA